MFNRQLESAQEMHNRVISDVANNSASNNPREAINNTREKNRRRTEFLLAGAGHLAEGVTLGYSPEEALAAISKETRSQQRKDETITEEDVMRQFAQVKKSLATDNFTSEMAGVAIREEPEVDPFGQMQDDIQTYDRDEAIRFGVLDPDMMSREERAIQNEGRSRPSVGSTASALRDAAARVQASRSGAAGVMNRMRGRDSQLAGSEAALARHLDAKIGRSAEAALAAKLAERDQAAMSEPKRFIHNVQSAVAAEQAKRSLPPEVAANLARATVANSQQQAAGMPQAAYTMMPGGGGVMGPAMVPVGPQRGIPLAPSSPMPGPAGVNTPDTANMLNAPSQQNAVQWVSQNIPNFREGGRVFGDFNQVDMTSTGQLLAQRALATGAYPQGIPHQDVRSVAELQKIIDTVQAHTAQQGTKMFSAQQVQDPTTGKYSVRRDAVPAAQVGAAEVMNHMRYTPEQSQALANKLYQTEVARMTTVNENPKANYFGYNAPAIGPKDRVVSAPIAGVSPATSERIRRHQALSSGRGAGVQFNAAEAINPREGEAPIARIQPGQKIEGRDIKAAFRGLQSPGARSNFIGEVEGGNPNIAGSNVNKRYIARRMGGKDTKNIPTENIPIAMARQEREYARKAGREYDPAKTEAKSKRAMLVREREERDAGKRERMKSRIRGKNITGEREMGSAPGEPSTPGATGYGSQLQQVQRDAQAQAQRMSDDDFNRRLVQQIKARRRA